MSTVNAAGLTADLEKRLAPFGVEPAAAAWLLKALHPASPTTSPGIPDSSYVHSVRPDFRSQTIIGAPTALATPTWDLLLWRAGGDVTPLRWCAAPGGSNFQSTVPIAGAVSGHVPMQAVEWAADGTLNDIAPGSANTLPYGKTVASDGVYCWRTQYASLTAYLTASALNDQGTVFATQQDREIIRDYGTLSFNTSVVSPTGADLLVSAANTSVPFDENEMLLMDPKAYTAPARDGVYIPIRLSGPAQPFAVPARRQLGLIRHDGAPPGVYGQLVGGSAFVPAHAIQVDLANRMQDYSGVFPIFNITSEQAYNFSYDNVHQSVVIFRGLAPAASVTLKLYTGLEQQPGIESVTRQFARVPNMYSPRAMEAYYRLVHEMPTCYPASFNSLGTILSAISGVASRLWPVVQRVVPAVVTGVRSAVEEYRRRAAPSASGDLALRQVVTTPAPAAQVKTMVPVLRARSRSKSVPRTPTKRRRRVRVSVPRGQ